MSTNQMLQPGQAIETRLTGLSCRVEQVLGGGTQGEVYRVRAGGREMAVKWYFPQYRKSDPRLLERLERACKMGPPSDRFLWPIELATSRHAPGFGYLMPLREPRFKGIVDLMKCRIDPTFRALATAGLELAHNYLQLHARGLCYRDISFGNVFFDPDSGQVRIGDNDNVDVNGQPGAIGGTPRFMAPEIVRGEAQPSTDTDLFSLAILLFYILVVHHPLEGKREAQIKCLDLPAMVKLYGTHPLFIYDPVNHSNRPVPGLQDNALLLWPIYPTFLRKLMTRAFTEGLRPGGRVRESEWRAALMRLRDLILYCPHCGAENFYDPDAPKRRRAQVMGIAGICWRCKLEFTLPPRLHVGRHVVILNHDTQIFPHHVDDDRLYDLSQAVGAVTPHPTQPDVWGLKNLTQDKWVMVTPDGVVRPVPPGKSLTLAEGTHVNFGRAEGEIEG